MSDSVQMPALGESVTEGTVTRWLKQVGERVEVDEPLLEVSTDKVDTEIPSPVAGVVEEILVGEDETVEVGATLAKIGAGGSGDGAGAATKEASQEAPEGRAPEGRAPEGEAPEGEAPEGEAPEGRAPEGEPQAAEEPPDDESGEGGGGSQEQAAEAPSTDQTEDQPKPRAEAKGSADGTKVTMPALGESVTEGTVTRWLKQEGESVDVDEPLLEVSTDKVDTEIPSPVAGVVQRILVAEDETVAVGAELAVIGDSAGEPERAPEEPQPEDKKAPAEEEELEKAPEGKPAEKAPEAKAPEGEAPQGRASEGRAAEGEGEDVSVYVTPLVRRLAAEHNVELGRVRGTGVGGRIRKQDVLDEARRKEEEAAKPAPSEAPQREPAAAPSRPVAVSAQRGTTEKMSRLRKMIAQRMVESLQISAQLTSVVEVDVTKIARLRARAKRDFEAREGARLSFMPFFALATVEALKQYPKLNASIDGDSIVYHAEENLGFAVDTERGLLAPVIRGAGDLNIAGLARKIADLAERTRINKITPDELGGGTFTLSNTGSRGALFDTPIINQPQVGILGTGAVVKRAVVVSGEDGEDTIAIRSMVYLALSYDHRLVDGADAARFLVAVKDRLEEGAFEADLGL
jgi:pyruvate dehydrogenase E2 component (dihydrolipoamide acetyltransferase)